MAIHSAFDIPRGTRVTPKDERIASILGRDRFIPSAGVVTGHAGRGGDYVIIKWDNGVFEETVHWCNVKLEVPND